MNETLPQTRTPAMHVERRLETALRTYGSLAGIVTTLLALGAVLLAGDRRLGDIEHQLAVTSAGQATLATTTAQGMAEIDDTQREAQAERRDLAAGLAEAIRRIAIQETIGIDLRRQVDWLMQRMDYEVMPQ